MDVTFSLNKIKENNTYRELRNYKNFKMNFSTNDYLGISTYEEFIKDFYKEFENKKQNNFMLSSSSSRLITGSYEIVLELENEVEKIYGKPCVVFNSGYDANSSILETFCSRHSLIISDRLNHASIYDGIISSGAKLLRYEHLDNEELEQILIEYSSKYKDIFVVTESVYSMDGDIFDLDKILELKKKYKFYLIVDEAHSYGVHGYGICYNNKKINQIDFLIIPLGKGGASVGAYVICSQEYKDYIINKSRKFIYSTALPPINNFWNLYVLKNMYKLEERQNNLKSITEKTLKYLKEIGINSETKSNIVSVIIGDNLKATNIANNLNKKGYVVHAIKEPTVPINTARLRLSLRADMNIDDIYKFLMELKNEIDSIF